MSDNWIRHATTASVLLVAGLSATVSYVHIRDLAVTHGGDRLTAALLPLLIDGTVAAMSCVMLRAARLEGVSTPWLARVMLAVSVGATLAANTAYGAAYGLAGALLWTLPAVMFVGCVEVSVAMVRRTRPVAVPEPVTPKLIVPEELNAMVTARKPPKASPRVTGRLTAKQEAAMRDVSVRTIYRERQAARQDMAMANGNGKAH